MYILKKNACASCAHETDCHLCGFPLAVNTPSSISTIRVISFRIMLICIQQKPLTHTYAVSELKEEVRVAHKYSNKNSAICAWFTLISEWVERKKKKREAENYTLYGQPPKWAAQDGHELRPLLNIGDQTLLRCTTFVCIYPWNSMHSCVNLNRFKM